MMRHALLFCALSAPALAEETLAGALAESPGAAALTRPAAAAWAAAPEPAEDAREIAFEFVFADGAPTLDAVDVETIDLVVDTALARGAGRVTIAPAGLSEEAEGSGAARAQVVRENLLAHGLTPDRLRRGDPLAALGPAPRVVVTLDRLGFKPAPALDRPIAFELPRRLTP